MIREQAIPAGRSILHNQGYLTALARRSVLSETALQTLIESAVSGWHVTVRIGAVDAFSNLGSDNAPRAVAVLLKVLAETSDADIEAKSLSRIGNFPTGTMGDLKPLPMP